MVIPAATESVAEVAEAIVLPLLPETIWNTLPASVKVILVTSSLLSVNWIVVEPEVNFKLREPGNNFSLNLCLSKVMA